MRYQKDICTCHGEVRYIVKKLPGRKLCARGNAVRLAESKKAARNKAPAIGNSDGSSLTQIDVFTQIWNSRPRVCVISGQVIKESPEISIERWVWCFSHIVPKGSYPDLALDPRNIVLKTPALHHDYHTKGKSELLAGPHGKRWEKIFAIKASLTAEAHGVELSQSQKDLIEEIVLLRS